MNDNLPLLGIGVPNVSLPRSPRDVAVQGAKRIWFWVGNAKNAAEAYSNAPGPDASEFAIADWVANYLAPRINGRAKNLPFRDKKTTEVEQIGDDQGGTQMPPMWRHDP